MSKLKRPPTESSRSQSPTSVKDVLNRYLEIYRLKDAFEETYVTAHWEKIMGRPIASRTTAVFVKGDKLYVQLDSAPLREELVRAKRKILELINNEMGKDLVKEIIYF